MGRGKKNPALYWGNWTAWSHSREYPWIDLGWLCEVWTRDGSKGENHYRLWGHAVVEWWPAPQKKNIPHPNS